MGFSRERSRSELRRLWGLSCGYIWVVIEVQKGNCTGSRRLIWATQDDVFGITQGGIWEVSEAS